MTSPEPNTDLAIAFLGILDKNGRHDLFAIHPTLPKGAPGQTEAATFLPNDHGDLREWIDAQQGVRGVYLSPNRGRDDESIDRRLSKDDIGVIRAIYADVDPTKIKGGDTSGEHFHAERVRLMALAKQLREDAKCPPSLIVDSGGGIQAWWMLSPHVLATQENKDRAEGIGRTLKAQFGGDGVFDVSRVLRLPGTINIPNAEKAAQGRKPALATILVEESSQNTYTLEQIAEWAPPTEKTNPKDWPKSPIDWDAVDTDTYDELPAALRAKFEAYCAARPMIGDLWRGKPASGQSDTSPSGFEFALGRWLRKPGTFTATEFAQLVAVWDYKSVKHAGDRRAVQNAWDNNPDGALGFVAMRQAVGADKIEWDEEPVDLWTNRAEAVDLPLGVVPKIIECVARDRGRRLGVEAGAPAAGLVTVLGSLIHAGNQMQPRQHDTKWTVKPITWTAIIGDSGTNKSATLGYAVEPAKTLQTKWNRDFMIARRAHTASQPLTPPERKKKRKSAAAQPAADVYEAPTVEALADMDAPLGAQTLRPVHRQKIANDATTEALGQLLANNPSGLLYFIDELAGLLCGMDAYRTSGGKDRPFWLMAKEGGDYTINRKTSDNVVMENCAISILGGIQPDKIRQLGNSLVLDGLGQRFLPISLRRTGSGEDIPPDEELDRTLNAVAVALDSCGNTGRPFRFAPEAAGELQRVEAFKDREIARQASSSALRQWLDKMPSEFARVALIFHCVEWYAAEHGAAGGIPPELVALETAQRARRYLTDFVYPHAQVFYLQVLGQAASDEHALWIAGHILTHGTTALDARDISRAYGKLSDLKSRHELTAAMRTMELLGWVKPTRRRDGISVAWSVNPRCHDGRFALTTADEKARRATVRAKIAA